MGGSGDSFHLWVEEESIHHTLGSGGMARMEMDLAMSKVSLLSAFSVRYPKTLFYPVSRCQNH